MTLQSNQDGPLRLRDWSGRLVIVNFWATWCAPCRKELSELQLFLDRSPQQAAVLGVALDQRGWAAVTPFVRQYAIRFPICLAEPSLLRGFGFSRSPDPLPQTLVFAGNGQRVLHLRSALAASDFERIAHTASQLSPR